MAQLTDNAEGHQDAVGWRRAHLALVDTAVPTLRVANLQCPLLRHRIVDAAEALVGRIGVTAHRQ